jgi:pseudaminic acid synthase
MVNAVREAEVAIGEINYSLTKKQMKGREFSRSLYVSNNVKIGDIVSEMNIKSVRPGFGLHPKYLPELIGKKFIKDVKKGERMSFDLVE